MAKAISTAIEKGGYQRGGCNASTSFSEDDCQYQPVLDPLFWQAYWRGRCIQEGSTIDESTIKKAARQSYNEYSDANWNGSTEQFWKELL